MRLSTDSRLSAGRLQSTSTGKLLFSGWNTIETPRRRVGQKVDRDPIRNLKCCKLTNERGESNVTVGDCQIEHSVTGCESDNRKCVLQHRVPADRGVVNPPPPPTSGMRSPDLPRIRCRVALHNTILSLACVPGNCLRSKTSPPHRLPRDVTPVSRIHGPAGATSP